MTTLRTAAQQALEALESAKMNHGKMLLSDPPQEAWRFHRVDETLSDAITALRAALAEPVQEPYCHVYEYDSVFGLHREFYPREYNGRKPDRTVPLFTAPPQRKPPTNQCGETCERAKLCAVCARGLEKPEGGGNLPPPLQVPTEVAATLTTTDIAWLSTHRLVKLWKEFGQMRWAGADEGWDRAIEAMRNRLDKECQTVLDWKAKADQSQATAVELLRKMQGVKYD